MVYVETAWERWGNTPTSRAWTLKHKQSLAVTGAFLAWHSVHKTRPTGKG